MDKNLTTISAALLRREFVESLGPSYRQRGLPLSLNYTILGLAVVQLGLVPDLI